MNDLFLLTGVVQYTCGSDSPCNAKTVNSHFASKNPGYFIQCDTGSRCYERPCAGKLQWDHCKGTCADGVTTDCIP